MTVRKTLGDLNSIVCFKAVVVGIEDTIGTQAAGVALKGAGRKRGRQLAESLGFGSKPLGLVEAARALDAAIGAEGTKLASVAKIESEHGSYKIYLSDTVCSAGEEMGSSRELSFTLGAVQGALEVLVSKKFRAKQIGSVLRGQEFDIVECSES